MLKTSVCLVMFRKEREKIKEYLKSGRLKVLESAKKTVNVKLSTQVHRQVNHFDAAQKT